LPFWQASSLSLDSEITGGCLPWLMLFVALKALHGNSTSNLGPKVEQWIRAVCGRFRFERYNRSSLASTLPDSVRQRHSTYGLGLFLWDGISRIPWGRAALDLLYEAPPMLHLADPRAGFGVVAVVPVFRNASPRGTHPQSVS
jgi:hypothetical protein